MVNSSYQKKKKKKKNCKDQPEINNGVCMTPTTG
jgi:hypothetical protein